MHLEQVSEQILPQDRFEKIAHNYSSLFSEVFLEQGLDYKELQVSVLKAVQKRIPNFREVAILDVGIGDGSTSQAFLDAGCHKITGIDLNSEMLAETRKKYGNSIHLVRMSATRMAFGEKDFPIVITGTAIHNIPKNERKKFWSELLRISPDIFVMAEKIVDPDPEKHKKQYNSEVSAIKKIYGKMHNLPDAEKTWVEHYEYDERERLDLREILEYLGEEYDISIVFEMGMYKTVVANKK